MTPKLLVVGASARAAAQSARAAGWSVEAADLFADTDLAAICPVIRVSDYPNSFESVLSRSDCSHWLYTGGLENYPDLLARMENLRPLWGTPANVVRQVRSPERLAACFRRHKIPFAQPQLPTSQPVPARPDVSRWVVKNRRSAGGTQTKWAEFPYCGQQLAPGQYLQRYLAGPTYSGAFVAEQDRVELLGVSRQLAGSRWLGAAEFRYCGSLGPCSLDTEQTREWERLGQALAAEFALRGVFGVDAIRRSRHHSSPSKKTRPARLWPLEVNPRYTASMEIHERAWRRSLLTCPANGKAEDSYVPETYLRLSREQRRFGIWGKAILFSDRYLKLPNLADFAATLEVPVALADLPTENTSVEPGDPICTLLAEHKDLSSVERRLRRVAETIRRQLQAITER